MLWEEQEGLLDWKGGGDEEKEGDEDWDRGIEWVKQKRWVNEKEGPGPLSNGWDVAMTTVMKGLRTPWGHRGGGVQARVEEGETKVMVKSKGRGGKIEKWWEWKCKRPAGLFSRLCWHTLCHNVVTEINWLTSDIPQLLQLLIYKSTCNFQQTL